MTEVRGFLEFMKYYRCFIKKYAQVAKPLYKLISGENASRKCNPIKWDPECHTAFDQLKDEFDEYLYRNTFNIYTDNNLLTYVMTTAKLDAMGHRWVTSFANYNFLLHYCPGRSSVEADALSRIDWGKNDQAFPAETIQAIVTAAVTGQGKDYIEAIPWSHQAIESFALPVHDNAQVVCKSKTMPEIDSNSDSPHGLDLSWNLNFMNTSDWVRVQAEDPIIHDLIQQYGTKELHKGKDTNSPEMKQFLWQRGKLIIRNGILYCKNDTKDSECPDWNTMQLVLPTILILQALKGCHEDLGHLGIERTLDLFRDQFY